MKWPSLPTGPDKPSWAGLFGAVPMVYVFWEPWQNGAPWIDWLWAALAFVSFFFLCLLGAIYWSRKRIMRGVCVAITAIAISFTAYRPSGVFFFIYVGAFAPLAAGGSIAGSAAIIAVAVALIIGEWSLLAPFAWMPYVVAAETILIGAAITVVYQQQMGVRQIVKTVERERIARDLHDILGHTLSVIILKSELARRLMEQDAERAKHEIEQIESISRSALAEVREAIVGYRAGDLASEFARAKATLESAGLAVEQALEATSMPIAHERVLALVVREAITNVIRHSQAKRCRMALATHEGTHVLQVRDDGRGGAHTEGNGMRGIRERIAALGGTVAWSFVEGTELTVTLPASAAGEAA